MKRYSKLEVCYCLCLPASTGGHGNIPTDKEVLLILQTEQFTLLLRLEWTTYFYFSIVINSLRITHMQARYFEIFMPHSFF